MSVREVATQKAHHLPTGWIVLFYIKRDRNWRNAINDIKDFEIVGCDDDFNSFLVCRFKDHLIGVLVLTHHNDHLIVWLHNGSIVASLAKQFTDGSGAPVFHSFQGQA